MILSTVDRAWALWSLMGQVQQLKAVAYMLVLNEHCSCCRHVTWSQTCALKHAPQEEHSANALKGKKRELSRRDTVRKQSYL